jgi:stage II sporulation protein D
MPPKTNNIKKTVQSCRHFWQRLFFCVVPILYCFVLSFLIVHHVFAFSLPFFQQDEPRGISLPLPRDKALLRTVRVAILKDEATATVRFDSHLVVQTIQGGKILTNHMSSGEVSIRTDKTGIALGPQLFKVYGVRIRSQMNRFRLNGREYRGDLVLIRQKDMTLLAINYADIDDYLKGVLPREVSPRWKMESLKAQAVASRTYALFQELSSFDRDYSLEATVSSQVYGGATSEQPETSQAVEATRGQIMLFNGELFPAYFHAACGGHTTRPETVWNTYANPVMSGVTDPYCVGLKHHEWNTTIPARDIEAALQKSKIDIGTVFSLEASRMDPSGRITEVIIHGTKNDASLRGNEFRLALGPQYLRSLKIKRLRKVDDSFYFEGYGWGHGVGLCQWGAKAMADNGFDYRQILRFYFQNAEIFRL